MSASGRDVSVLPVAHSERNSDFLGQPRGLILLFFVEMWERFSYYGMKALLILYLVDAKNWPVSRAANLYGNYTALAYIAPLLGGYVADRLLGARRSLVWGGVIIALGHFTLALETTPTFYLGLGLVILGTGLFKPNVSTMVGQLYAPEDKRRDAGFTIFFMGISVGAFLARWPAAISDRKSAGVTVSARQAWGWCWDCCSISGAAGGICRASGIGQQPRAIKKTAPLPLPLKTADESSPCFWLCCSPFRSGPATSSSAVR